MKRHSLVLLDPQHFHAELAARCNCPEIGERFRCADLADFEVLVRSGKIEPAQTIVVLAGRNDLKAGYALAALEAGCHVLADKPLAIDRKTLETFELASDLAEAKGLLFADMMTERMNRWNQEVARLIWADGLLERISGVEMRSVHHFFKTVAGKPLTRPAWYYDTAKQGEGLVDVTTHLLDNTFWQVFPNAAISSDEIRIRSARRWPTRITPEQFFRSTGETVSMPFDCNANGEFDAVVRGIPLTIAVEWRFEAPLGGGDTSVASFRFWSKSKTPERREIRSVALRSDETTGFCPRILIDGDVSGLSIEDPGHESHFALVVRECLDWLKAGAMPELRRDLMRTKYRTLVRVRELSHGIFEGQDPVCTTKIR